MIDEKLKAVVKAQNRAAERAVRLYDELAAVFAPFVGKQVCKKDGPLLAKVEALLPKLENTPALTVYKHYSNYSLVWVIKACETVFKDGEQVACEYREVSVYVGELSNGILTSLCKRPEGLRHDYTPEEVELKREAVRKAKKDLDEATSKLHPFGEW
jgi:hypothetical protein